MSQLIAKSDPEIAAVMEKEHVRQLNTLELIASENVTSAAVMAVQGSVLTNKYAEGYPNARYYGGCEEVDVAEQLAIDRARKLFDAAYINVQPHSGSQANMAVYMGFLKPGDSVLGMSLAHGGHLTHGSPVNFSGRLFNFAHYGLDPDTERLDYDDVYKKAQTHQPKMIVAGASAYPRIIDFERLADIAASVKAYLMVDMAHIAGLVATGLHPSPVPLADVVTSTTHKTLRGPRGGLILSRTDHSAILNKQIFPGIQGGPLMHVIAAKALAFKEALATGFVAYQQQVVNNAKTMAEKLMAAGLKLVSGGTDNHMLLVDLRSVGLTGLKAEEVLERSGVTVNKNAVPFDTESPRVTSGVRIGTPAVTTRGMKTAEMETIAALIAAVLKDPDNPALITNTRQTVTELCRRFPLYPEPVS